MKKVSIFINEVIEDADANFRQKWLNLAEDKCLFLDKVMEVANLEENKHLKVFDYALRTTIKGLGIYRYWKLDKGIWMAFAKEIEKDEWKNNKENSYRLEACAHTQYLDIYLQ